MEAISSVMYWVRLGMLGLGTMMAFVAFGLTVRKRGFTVLREIEWIVMTAALPIALSLASGVSPNAMWAAILGVAGLALGFGCGMLSGFSPKEGKMRLGRFFLGPFVVLIMSVLGLSTLLFGSTTLFRMSLEGLVLATTLVVGQAAAETMRAMRRRGKGQPPAQAQPAPQPQ